MNICSVMNQIIATLAISYGSSYFTPYLYRLAIDCFTSAILNKTSTLAKTGITKAWSKATNEPPQRDPIEYELISSNLDEANEIIIVNSKERKKSIDESWSKV